MENLYEITLRKGYRRNRSLNALGHGIRSIVLRRRRRLLCGHAALLLVNTSRFGE